MLLFSIGVKAQKGFEVKIKLESINDNKIRIYSQRNNKYVIDTLTKGDNDIFSWKGYTEDPQLARIEVLDTTLYLKVGKAVAMPPALMFLLTNTHYQINGKAKEVFLSKIISDDIEVNAYEKFRLQDTLNVIENYNLQKLQNQKYNLKDTAGLADIASQMRFYKKKNQKDRSIFIDNHPNAYASLLMLQSLFLVLTNSELDQKFNTFSEAMKQSKTGININSKIESNKNTGIGKPVIPFAQTGIDGKLVDIANLKGKVVLIDFWGSWCVPCRLSHPGLKKLYEKYKDKGFEIIGIANEVTSTDPADKEKAWRKAVKEDGINWLHILYDPALFDAVKAYDINGYPTKFLIDQNGKFVLRILGNSETLHKTLEAKLSELLPK
jgi:thiol-disulfide isomerase/thioredoxin